MTPSYTVVQNWALVLQKFRATLRKWAQRDLSFFGRAQVLKTYVMSKLCYVAHTLTMPRVTMEQVESLMWEFLWQGSTHQVGQSVCISPVGKGGLGMPHLPSKLAAIHSRCLQCLFDPVNNAALAAVFIEPASGQYRMGLGIFAASTWKPDYRNMARTPPFYRSLLRLWLRYDGGRDTRPPEYYEDAMLEPLWGNVLIRDAQNRPLYYPSVAKCRYSTVGDVYAREPPHP